VITVNLRANVRADVGDRKYYGPGKKIALNGWTRVFGITRGDMKGRIHRTLALEVK
jgi:hypothetical protein